MLNPAGPRAVPDMGRVLIFGMFLIAGMADPSPDPHNADLSAGLAHCWSRQPSSSCGSTTGDGPCRTRIPLPPWPTRTVFAAVRRPAKGLSSARPVHPQAAGRCAARTRTPTAAALKCRVSSVNQGRKHDDAGKHHQCHDERPRRNAREAPGAGLPAHPAVPITIVNTPHGQLLATLPWRTSCLYLTVTAGQLQSGKRIVTNSETRRSGPDIEPGQFHRQPVQGVGPDPLSARCASRLAA